MIKIAVCDDSPECVQNTNLMIEKWVKENNIIAEILCFDNGDALINKSLKYKFDIVFLDIVMPLLNGMDTARELRNHDKATKIVFLTSSPEFALESYSVKASDYCLKPVTYEKIHEVLDDCAKDINEEPKNLTIKSMSEFKKIYLHDI